MSEITVIFLSEFRKKSLTTKSNKEIVYTSKRQCRKKTRQLHESHLRYVIYTVRNATKLRELVTKSKATRDYLVAFNHHSANVPIKT